MKRFRIASLILSFVLILSACAARQNPAAQNSTESEAISDTAAQAETTGAESDPAESDPVTETESAAPEETSETGVFSSAFTDLFPECPEQVMAVLYNAPFVNGAPAATETWCDGAYDQLYILPRYIGSTVKAYALTFTEEGEIEYSPSPVYSTLAEDGTVIYASLARPEGLPAWYLEFDLPDGRQNGLILSYNGRTGTPTYEFINADPEHPDDFVTDVLGAEITTASESDLNSFADAAERSGLDVYEAAKRYFTQITEIGDGSAFTLSYGHEMDQDTYKFQIARFHTNYFVDGWDLEKLVQAQYDLYKKIGNDGGILGPEFSGNLPELQYQLTGLTVFNHFLAAREIEIKVNGETLGTFELKRDSFCTLIPVDLPEMTADCPISVEVKIISTYFGSAENAWIDVFGGITSNISNAL